ncbi:hypothetical protein ABT234_31450 [Streptomyces sp. NPDC001586]|uniref:hypothetical protein n=1 Tax=Streptomyces sp. NPDC001586 TaxID=3154387 RepID=UPI00332FDDA0
MSVPTPPPYPPNQGPQSPQTPFQPRTPHRMPTWQKAAVAALVGGAGVVLVMAGIENAGTADTGSAEATGEVSELSCATAGEMDPTLGLWKWTGCTAAFDNPTNREQLYVVNVKCTGAVPGMAEASHFVFTVAAGKGSATSDRFMTDPRLPDPHCTYVSATRKPISGK